MDLTNGKAIIQRQEQSCSVASKMENKMSNGNQISLSDVLNMGIEKATKTRSITKKIIHNLAQQQDADLALSFGKMNRPDMLSVLFELKITKKDAQTQKATGWNLRADFIKGASENTYADFKNVTFAHALVRSTDFDYGYKPSKTKKNSRNYIFENSDHTGNVVTFSAMLDAIMAADRVGQSMGKKPCGHMIQGKTEIEQKDIYFPSPKMIADHKKDTGKLLCDVGCPSHRAGHTSSFFKHGATDCGFSYATGQSLLANGLVIFVIPFVGYWICEISDDEMLAIMIASSQFSVDGNLNAKAKKLIACVQAKDSEWNNGKKFM